LVKNLELARIAVSLIVEFFFSFSSMLICISVLLCIVVYLVHSLHTEIVAHHKLIDAVFNTFIIPYFFGFSNLFNFGGSFFTFVMLIFAAIRSRIARGSNTSTIKIITNLTALSKWEPASLP